MFSIQRYFFYPNPLECLLVYLKLSYNIQRGDEGVDHLFVQIIQSNIASKENVSCIIFWMD